MNPIFAEVFGGPKRTRTKHPGGESPPLKSFRIFSVVQFLREEGIGWGDFITSEPRYPHDFIELTYPGHKRISEKAVELYQKGHSIAETAAMVGVPTTTFFDELKARGIPTRSASEARKTNSPYGYAWLSGEIVMNPLEYKNVLLIIQLSKMGKRPHQIANYLNDQGVRPRRGKKWFARTVTDILSRNHHMI